MNNPIFDEIIDTIITKLNWEIYNKIEKIPSVYYIGMGKTGGQSISSGFPKNTCAHWHSLNHFEKSYKTNLLSTNKYDLYDLILYIGKKYGFKPLIIESIRDPIEYYISAIFENCIHSKSELFHKTVCDILDGETTESSKKTMVTHIQPFVNEAHWWRPYSYDMWKKYFHIDLLELFDYKKGYYYNELDDCKLLLIRYENITLWNSIFTEIGYDFTLKGVNLTKDKKYNIPEYYKYVKENIKFSKDILNSHYDIPLIKALYSTDDIDNFYKKWLENTNSDSILI